MPEFSERFFPSGALRIHFRDWGREGAPPLVIVRMALGAAAAGARRHLNAPNVDKLIQRVKTWLQDFF